MIIRSLLLVTAATCLTYASAANAQAVKGTDNYLCYDVKDFGTPPDTKVSVGDQFGNDSAVFGKPRLLCNPTSVDGLSIANEEAHLVCFETKTGIQPKNVEVSNGYFTGRLYLGDASLLCIVSLKKVIP